MKQDKLIQYIKEYLTNKKQLSIGTYDNEPWGATLYYAADDDLNLYVLTNPDSIHGVHISNNPRISVIVADSPQDPASKKKGLQMFALCTLLTADEEVDRAIKLWNKALNVQSTDYSLDGIKSGKISGRMYKITPKKIKFFNEVIAEEGREQLIEL